MTPYQRGNRDALLNFAALARQRMAAYAVEIERSNAVLDSARGSVQANAAKRLGESALWRAMAWESAAREAERMAEAMPEDPEEVDVAR